MPFFRPVLEHYKSMQAKVSVSICKARSQKIHVFKVRLGEPALKALRLAKGDRIEALWGSGSDAGRILLQRSQSGAGGKLRNCGRSTSTTLEASIGNLPRLPILSDDRQRWTLRIEVHPAARLDWQPYPGQGLVAGIMATLPAEWWVVEAAAHPLRAGYPNRAA